MASLPQTCDLLAPVFGVSPASLRYRARVLETAGIWAGNVGRGNGRQRCVTAADLAALLLSFAATETAAAADAARTFWHLPFVPQNPKLPSAARFGPGVLGTVLSRIIAGTSADTDADAIEAPHAVVLALDAPGARLHWRAGRSESFDLYGATSAGTDAGMETFTALFGGMWAPLAALAAEARRDAA